MVACLSCNPADAFYSRTQFMISHNRRNSNRDGPKFGSQEALVFLQNCNNFNQIKLVHAKIIRHGLSNDQLLVRKLLHFCSCYGKLEYATRIFHQVRAPHTFTWNFMIRVYTSNGKCHQALLLYNLMICQGFPPDKFTFPFVIKACLGCSDIYKGREVHGFAIKTGFWIDMFLHHTLMDLYLKCGDVGYGRKVFELMRVRNVVSWTTLIAGLVACGQLDAAQGAFERMPTRNVVSWTAMIEGYARERQPQEALELFRKMMLENVRPNEFTLVSLLKVCAELGSLKLGNWIHEYALKNGFDIGVFLGTALIDMYSKCGSLDDARKVFEKMKTKSLATWNSMITSFGVHGFGEEAIALFSKMEETNVQPDAITFVGVLCACLQTSNVEEGNRYFEYMTEQYGITPIPEHHSCLIELNSCAKLSNEACNSANNMEALLNNNAAATVNETKYYYHYQYRKLF